MTSATSVACPHPACERAFTCDACMHSHLLRRHNARWVDAFGPAREAWVEFCERHAACSPAMLGL